MKTPPTPRLERHERFRSGFLTDDRAIVVYLPPGYDADPAARFPVLYMHDGQNLFEADTAYREGEYWRVGETADALINAGRVEPLIIVGIANTGAQRIHEYTPTSTRRHGGGRADRYARLVADELKPFIDRTYRTRPDAASTGLGGSSLGGLVTLYIGLHRPDVFSRLAVLSPSVWWDRRVILREVRRTKPEPRPRIWLDMGTAERGRAQESQRALDDVRLLRTGLVKAGWKEGVDLAYSEHPGATHSESAWAERVGPMLEWLYR